MSTTLLPSRQININRDRVNRTPVPVDGVLLTGSAATLYTAPTITANPTGTSHASSLLKLIILCNTDSSARTFTLYIIPSGGSAADRYAIFKGASIAAGQTLEYTYDDDTHPLGSASFIQGLADVTSKVSIRLGVVQLN